MPGSHWPRPDRMRPPTRWPVISTPYSIELEQSSVETAQSGLHYYISPIIRSKLFDNHSNCSPKKPWFFFEKIDGRMSSAVVICLAPCCEMCEEHLIAFTSQKLNSPIFVLCCSHLRLEAELAEMSWRIKWEDVQFQEKRGLKRSNSRMSLTRVRLSSCISRTWKLQQVQQLCNIKSSLHSYYYQPYQPNQAQKAKVSGDERPRLRAS